MANTAEQTKLDLMLSALQEDTLDRKPVKKRDRGYYRRERRQHIRRKQRIIKEVGNGIPFFVCKHTNMLSKGKIHCSCPYCTFHGPSHSDMKKNAKARDALKDFNDLER